MEVIPSRILRGNGTPQASVLSPWQNTQEGHSIGGKIGLSYDLKGKDIRQHREAG